MKEALVLDGKKIRVVERAEEVPWDVEVDVLVIGAGGCGLVAALAAAEKGAQVFVVEKEKTAGGNTSLSQAMVPAAGSRLQREAEVTDTVDQMARDIQQKNHHESDPEMTRHVASHAAKLVDWLNDHHGVKFELVTDFLYPGHSTYRIHANPSRKGLHLVNDLVAVAARMPNIDIAYNAPAQRLVADGRGAVLGAEIEIKGIGTNLARAKEVILALNGFGANREMLKRYIPEMSDAYYFGHEGNTGEGILWGEALGGVLESMASYQSHGSVAHPHGTLVTWAIISLGGYQMNLGGKRFVNEYHGYSEHALDVLAQEGGVAIEVFDQRIYDVVLAYEDFQQCISMGAIKRFDTMESLAEGFGLPAEAALATHSAFQQSARGEGKDAFGRSEFGAPLAPPFYGVKVTGALFHTQGGLKIDRQARVLKPDGSCIPHLYAGGGTAVGFSGKAGPSGYLSANGLLAALILGKIAGEEAGLAAASNAS